MCAWEAPGLAGDPAAAGPGDERGQRLLAPEGTVERSFALAVRLRAGQALYGAGQTGDAVFVLHRGLVKETLEANEGERVVRLIGVAGVTGLAALLGEPHRHSAQVVGDGEACRVPVTRLRERIRSDPQGAFALLAHWQGALDDTDHIIAAFATGPARARLARYILFLLDTLDAQARLRRQEAAELIGVTPVSVTRLIGEFKREGLVRENGLQLLVDCDRLRLVRLAGGASGANGASGASVTGDAGEPSAAIDEGGPDSAGSPGGAAAAARVGRAPVGRLDDQVAAAARES
jgi:CRP-like cAMP-binding protein